jgi:hypothetical protein
LLTLEVVSFLAGLPRWEERKHALRHILTSPYRWRASENALLALYLAARARTGPGKELGRILDDDIPESAQLAGAQLAGLSLDWISLPGADLQGANLAAAQLRFADLRGARLDGARADHAVLDGALLDGASLRDADLYGVSMVDASIAGTQWERASYTGLIDIQAEPTDDLPELRYPLI